MRDCALSKCLFQIAQCSVFSSLSIVEHNCIAWRKLTCVTWRVEQVIIIFCYVASWTVTLYTTRFLSSSVAFVLHIKMFSATFRLVSYLFFFPNLVSSLDCSSNSQGLNYEPFPAKCHPGRISHPHGDQFEWPKCHVLCGWAIRCCKGERSVHSIGKRLRLGNVLRQIRERNRSCIIYPS